MGDWLGEAYELLDMHEVWDAVGHPCRHLLNLRMRNECRLVARHDWVPETTGFERILHLDRRFPQPGRESPAVFGTENHRYVK